MFDVYVEIEISFMLVSNIGEKNLRVRLEIGYPKPSMLGQIKLCMILVASSLEKRISII